MMSARASGSPLLLRLLLVRLLPLLRLLWPLPLLLPLLQPPPPPLLLLLLPQSTRFSPPTQAQGRNTEGLATVVPGLLLLLGLRGGLTARSPAAAPHAPAVAAASEGAGSPAVGGLRQRVMLLLILLK